MGAFFGAPIFREVGCDVVDVVSARDSAAVAALCREDLDLISVQSPPFLHIDHVRLAIAAGRSVLCDKPFGTSADEAAVLAAEAKAAGVIHLANFEFRHQPARRKMHELITSGQVGRPEHIHYSAYSSGSRFPLRPYGWLFDRSLGGGWIGAFGSHVIDNMRWMMGEIRDAGAKRWVTIPERFDREGSPQTCNAEDTFSAWLEFDSGATGSIDTTFTASVSLPHCLTITGSEGTIENTGQDTRVVLQRVDGTREEFDFEPRRGDPHLIAMRLWALEVWRSVVEKDQIRPSLEDGVACARVMDLMRSGEVTVVDKEDSE
jgi:predicted dehydrogenase